MVSINRKLKWSQNHLLRNRNEVSLKTCFLEFLNFQNSFFHKLKWLFPVEINNFNNNLFWSHWAEFDQVNNYGFFPNCQKLVNPSHILISHIITWNGALKSKKTSIKFQTTKWADFHWNFKKVFTILVTCIFTRTDNS